jgi:predicted RNase H-like HicB family nuclease
VLRLTALIEREGDGHVSTCQELDIVSQGRTIEEARLNLVEAVEGFLEAASASEIRRRLKTEEKAKTAPEVRPYRPLGSRIL